MHLTQLLIWYNYWRYINYHCFHVVISKRDEVPVKCILQNLILTLCLIDIKTVFHVAHLFHLVVTLTQSVMYMGKNASPP